MCTLFVNEKFPGAVFSLKEWKNFLCSMEEQKHTILATFGLTLLKSIMVRYIQSVSRHTVKRILKSFGKQGFLLI